VKRNEWFEFTLQSWQTYFVIRSSSAIQYRTVKKQAMTMPKKGRKRWKKKLPNCLPCPNQVRRKSPVNALEGEDGRVLMRSKKGPNSLPHPDLALTRSPEGTIQAK
jgi:hypothetical protein